MSSDSTHGEYEANIDFGPVPAQYLRIAATGGDNSYSIGEFQASGSMIIPDDGNSTIPELSSLLSLGALLGFGLMFRSRH